MSHVEPALPSFVEAAPTPSEVLLLEIRDSRTDGTARLTAHTAFNPTSRLEEWLLSTAFRALCQMMRAAAQFCGILVGDEAANVQGIVDESRAPELQTLCLSELPLCEIAAAERERIWRIEAARADAPLRYHPGDAFWRFSVLETQARRRPSPLP
jgi:hypothetical protein